jgi:hypothetical protein
MFGMYAPAERKKVAAAILLYWKYHPRQNARKGWLPASNSRKSLRDNL